MESKHRMVNVFSGVPIKAWTNGVAFDEKAEALTGGKGSRDLMSLLGSCQALITTPADIISQFMQTHRRMSALACQMKK